MTTYKETVWLIAITSSKG